MYWTKKHQEWRFKFNIRPSTAELWQWINRKTKGNTIEEIEVDLKQFNQWVNKKRGRPYDRKTLKFAMEQLLTETGGLFTEHRKVSWYYFKIVVKPISFLTEKKSNFKDESPNSETTESIVDGSLQKASSLQQQHNINTLNEVFSSVGLKYDRAALNRIWSFAGRSFERVREAIELMLYRHRTKAVSKPHGFIVDCLKYNWQQGFDPLYEPELPKFVSNRDLVKFVDLMMPRKTPF